MRRIWGRGWAYRCGLVEYYDCMKEVTRIYGPLNKVQPGRWASMFRSIKK